MEACVRTGDRTVAAERDMATGTPKSSNVTSVVESDSIAGPVASTTGIALADEDVRVAGFRTPENGVIVLVLARICAGTGSRSAAKEPILNRSRAGPVATP